MVYLPIHLVHLYSKWRYISIPCITLDPMGMPMLTHETRSFRPWVRPVGTPGRIGQGRITSATTPFG